MNPLGLDVGGYVLAGGRSSRMGRDKALLELGGKPLALHAVTKLQRVCSDVHILSANRELAGYAPLVRDLHPVCGPIGGIEAAFAHSTHEWNLFLPVDMPFFPSALLFTWVGANVASWGITGARLAFFTVFGKPQPLFCLLHREVAPLVGLAVERGEYKVLPVLENAGKQLAERYQLPLSDVFCNVYWGEWSSVSTTREGKDEGDAEAWLMVTEAQQKAKHLWFANLNTPEEFREAELHLDALDT